MRDKNIFAFFRKHRADPSSTERKAGRAGTFGPAFAFLLIQEDGGMNTKRTFALAATSSVGMGARRCRRLASRRGRSRPYSSTNSLSDARHTHRSAS
jgi:hypothetical protein